MTVLIQGASGRLGQLILQECARKGLEAVPLPRINPKEQTRDQHQWFGTLNEGSQTPMKPWGLLDVSLPQGTETLVTYLTEKFLSHGQQEEDLSKAHDGHLPEFLIIGTTGHSLEQIRRTRALAQHMTVVLVPNFSRGILLMQEMLAAKTSCGQTVAELARTLGFDVGLVETHHTAKRDAPSGTALALAQSAVIESDKIACLRVGQVIGEHTVYLSGEHEDIRFSHCAGSRQVFASGAVDLVGRLFRKPRGPGLYEMIDILTASAE